MQMLRTLDRLKERRVMKKGIPVQQGRRYEIDVKTLGTSGEGVGRSSNFTIFVPGALPGERTLVRIDEVKKTYARGKLLEILEKSPERVAPVCSIYDSCGGCQLQHLSYEGQLRWKRQQVVDALERIGGLSHIEVLPVLGAQEPWFYRNKMQFPVGRKQGKTVIGCFAKGSHDIVDTRNCRIQKEGNNIIINAMREIVDRLHIPIYDEDCHTGVLRHIVGRIGENGEAMVVLVTAAKDLPKAKEITRLLRERVPNLKSVQQNIQTYRNNVILGRETKLLWGKPTIPDRIDRLRFSISARSFFQVNTEQAALLYEKTLEYAGLSGKEIVIDAYCGTGTITLFLAQKAHSVYGIEIVKPAIEDAKKNARDNHIKNASFLVGDATRLMPHLYREKIRPAVIVVDPPRAGCTETVLKTFAAMHPARIIYVSCNPATLARDIAILTELGYMAERIQPVDMFPQTSHVETVTKLIRKDLL